MTVKISEFDPQSGWLRIDIVGNATAAGLVGEVENPEGVLLQVYDGILYIEEGAHAAAEFNVGFAATGVDNDDMFDGFTMNKSDGTIYKAVGTDLAAESAGTHPKGHLWSTAELLTITSAAQVSTGLLASLFLRYIRLSDQK